MGTIKYKVIKSKDQYDTYCYTLEHLMELDNQLDQDEIELLTFLIEKWDEEHNTLSDLNPIDLLNTLMSEHQLKAKDLVDICGLSKGTISKILNYQKGLSKDSIRSLSNYFKVSQEAFNRPYLLRNEVNQVENSDKRKCSREFAHRFDGIL